MSDAGIRTSRAALLLGLFCGLFAPQASAGEVGVLRAAVSCDEKSVCRVVATLRHADVGWKHYADRFEVLDDEGNVLGVRELAHPHVHEQPFTRALEGLALPPTLERVRIRGRDSVHGYGAEVVTVPVLRPGRAAKTPGVEGETPLEEQ